MNSTPSSGQPRESGANEKPSADTNRRRKSRSRASVACETCRERRTKCVILLGTTGCTQCRSLGSACVIKHDDERRRPSSKAYVNSLNERIIALETALAEKNHGLHAANDDAPAPAVITTESPPLASDGRSGDAGPEHGLLNVDGVNVADSGMVNSPSSQSDTAVRDRNMLRKLLSHDCHVSFDRHTGERLRLFGPTANCHVLLDPELPSAEARKPAQEQARRAQRVISSISAETHDYLLGLFWDLDNAIIPLVDRPAFEEGCRNGDGPLYSWLLHLCILAIGFRYADKARPDIAKIYISQHESIFHIEAKFMVDYECERPTKLPSIAALLLLGDLEGGVGRDSAGWLYTGMASRLCLDMGLHCEERDSNIPVHEFQVSRMTFLACVVYDRYWALFLGRPANFGLDTTIPRLSNKLEPCHESQTDMTAKAHEALIDLLEIGCRIIRLADQAWKLTSDAEPHNHLFTRMADLSRELDCWYARLPRSLKWTAQNIQTSPSVFFLLHQQYHANVILLHLPFAKLADDTVCLEPIEDLDNEHGHQFNAHLALTCRIICRQHAIRAIHGFWRHGQRFDRGKVFGMSLQPIGAAAVALIRTMALSEAPRSANAANMRYLICAIQILTNLSLTYPVADRMCTVLQTATAELREQLSMPEEQTSGPVRRNSVFDECPGQLHSEKRRRPSEHLRSKDLTSNFHPDVPVAAQRGIPANENLLLATQSLNASDGALPTSGMSGSTLPDGYLATTQAESSNTDDAELLLRGAERLSASNRPVSRIASPQDLPSTEPQRSAGRRGGESGDSSSDFQSSELRNQVLEGLHCQSLFPNITGLDFLSVLSGVRDGRVEKT